MSWQPAAGSFPESEPAMAVSNTHRLNDPIHARRDPITAASIRNDLGISRERMAQLLDVSSRTIARWEDQGQLPSNRWIRRVLIQIGNIIDLASESLAPEGVRAFMTMPQPIFGNRSGIEMIELGEAETVYRELAGMAEGYTGS
jgi:DNA-binding transcriptional regulator YiaG